MFFFPPVPILDSVFDIVTLSVISGILVLSLLSVTFILHLRLESRRSHHLRDFSSLWTVRFLLVFFITLWVINEIVRIPFFRRRYLYPTAPALTLYQQATLCKIHVVLSLGLFEPGFLLTLLFLVNVSTKKRNPHDLWAIAFVFFTCLPILSLQALSVFFSPSDVHLPDIFRRTFVLSEDDVDNKSVTCAYPLLNTIVFGAFGIAYTLVFLLSCWRVVSIVINNGIRVRINVLAFSLSMLLPMQILFLGVSSFWGPETAAYGGIMVAMYLCMSVSAAVAEVILVIKPIADALSAGGDCCRWSADGLRPEVDREGRLLEGSL